MSSGDAARALGVSARQVRRLVETEALTEVDRVGGTQRFRATDAVLERWRRNVTLRAIDHASRALRLASTTAVALDLAESLSSRERSAGLRMLEHKLRAS